MCEIIRKWLKIKLNKEIFKNEIVRLRVISTFSLVKYVCKDKCVL